MQYNLPVDGKSAPARSPAAPAQDVIHPAYKDLNLNNPNNSTVVDDTSVVNVSLV